MAFFPALIALAALSAICRSQFVESIIAPIARVAPPESMGLILRTANDVLSPNSGALLSSGLVGTLVDLLQRLFRHD